MLFIIQFIHRMGYNSACYVHNCASNCCNFYGFCPDYGSSQSTTNQCWNYYSNTCSVQSYNCCYSTTDGYYACNPVNVGAIVGGVIAGVVVLVLIIILIVCLCKKCRKQPAMQQPPSQTLVIGQPVGQPGYTQGQYQMQNPPYNQNGGVIYNDAPYDPNMYGGSANNLNHPNSGPINIYPQQYPQQYPQYPQA